MRTGFSIDVPGGGSYPWRGFPSTSLRRGDWKLIEFHENDSIGLYHLKDDPGEKNHLAESMPDRAAQLRAELDNWQAATQAPVPTEPNLQCVLGDVKAVAK